MSVRSSRGPDRRIGRAARSLLRELPGVTPAIVVLVLLACLLVPLPAALVDLLLALGFAAALVLLVASVQARRVTDLLGFPALVLVLTLARLAVNVSTTRLILAEADAGRVVDAFARLVVRDDVIIGAVMFAVITAIQYLVLARGAERIAEVAARFALDALPGRQQAIDADLRAGAIGPRDAEARRGALAERADLAGRMDGVMRWVKHDATVGLLITATNFGGGLIIGVARHGLGVGESAALYGRLAIGDGLMAQIPALLIAFAAALVVTRIDGGDGRAPVAWVGAWIEPSMLLAPAALLAGLALVPGMPRLAFAAAAATLLTAALVVLSERARSRPRARVELRLGPGLAELEPSPLRLAAVRVYCEDSLAVEVPPLTVVRDPGPRLAADELELRHGGRVLGRVRLGPGTRAGPRDAEAVCVATLRLLLDRAERFVTLADIEAELARCRAREPELVRQATRAVETVDLLRIVRGFVRERIPAPSVELLVWALAERRVFGEPSERSRWPEHAREALADVWVRDLCEGVAELGTACWLRPTADLEEAVLAGALADDAGVRLRLSASERARLCARFRRKAGGRPALVVCTPPARAALAAALAGSKPRLIVLSLAELIAGDVELPATVPVDLDA